MKTTGSRIKARREELGLTQPELGRAVGVTKSAVSQWENGDTKGLRPDNLLAVSKALQCDIEWLITGKDGKKSPVQQPSAPPTLDLSLLVATVRDIEEIFRRNRRHPSPEATAQIVAWWYRHMSEDERHEKPPERDGRAMLRLVSSR